MSAVQETLVGGAVLLGGEMDLEGGSPKGHKKVMRKDGTHYWKVVDKRFKHHLTGKKTGKSPARKSASKRSASRNPWVMHVKKYAREHKISYGEALTKAKSSYK